MPAIILSDNGVSSGSAGLKTSGSNDGLLALQTTTAGGTATTAVTINTSQNVGVGVTPSAWGSIFRALQLGNGASIWGRTDSTAFTLSQNAYRDTSNNYTYIQTAAAGYYQIGSGIHSWYNAASGTANTTITFTQAMTLDASGNLGVGTTSPSSFDNSWNRLVVGTGSGDAGQTIYAGSASTASIAFADGTSGAQQYAGLIRYLHASDAMTFWTGAAERARIDSSGNFGIGTTSPANKLQVNGVIATQRTTDSAAISTISNETGNFVLTAYSGYNMAFVTSGSERMRLDASGNLGIGTTSPQYQLDLNKTGSTTLFGSGINADLDSADIALKLTSWGGSGGRSGSIRFLTGAGVSAGTVAERARIDSSGNLLVGTTTSTASALGGGRLVSTSDGTNFAGTFYQSSTSSSVYTMRVRHDNTTSGAYIQFVTDTNVETGRIYDSAGTMQYASSSDARLKTNVQPIQNGLSSVLALNPCTFDMRRGENTFIPSAGLIAQEVHAVYPFAVGVGGDDENTNPWSVDYGKLTPLLIKAIQELKAEFDAYKLTHP